MDEKEKQSEHYHNELKGCKTEKKEFFIKRGNQINKLTGGYCKTHQKDICRCGWERHWHYGTYSLAPEKT